MTQNADHAVASRRLSPEDRRRALLETGLQLFGSAPFDQVSLEDIARAAGVSQPLIQHYFASKRGYFVAVARHGLDNLEATTRTRAEGGAFEALESNLRAFFQFFGDHPAVAGLLKTATGFPEVAEMIDAYRSRTVDIVLDVLPVDARTAYTKAAIHAWNGLNQALVTRLRDDPSLTVDWAARFSRDALLSLLKLAEHGGVPQDKR